MARCNKHRKKRRSNKIKKSYAIPLNMPVMGLEGHINNALSFAFHRRVQWQLKRNMHHSFPNAQFGIVGGTMQHLVVRSSLRNGWMITDENWMKYPPEEIVSSAIDYLMARSPGMRKSKARELIQDAIAASYNACKNLRQTLQRRRPQVQQNRRPHRAAI